jgi:ABC-type lipoprotein export system ATPase subunit
MSDQQERPLVSARDVRKSYVMGKRTVEVLRGVSLTVPRGDFQALRGASGAGKSTLLHLIGGLDTPNSGEIWFGDRDLARLSRNDLAEFRNLRVGLIFQGYHLFPELDAVENVSLPARMARKNATEVAERARMLLKRVGLEARMEHRPSEMSGGEQQRVAIARALINEPELIIADEPTGNLDSRTGQEIIELLCSLREENGTTLLIATHDLKVAARAPKVIHLVDGQIDRTVRTSDVEAS